MCVCVCVYIYIMKISFKDDQIKVFMWSSFIKCSLYDFYYIYIYIGREGIVG